MPTTPQPSPADILQEYPRFPHFSPTHLAKIQELCGPRWIDLLLHIPARVLDKTNTPTIAEALTGERATLMATVAKRPNLPPPRTKRPLSIELKDETGTLRAIYFNASSWLERAYPVGETVIVSGKIEADSKGKKMLHPDVYPSHKGMEDIAKFWPLYPLTGGLPMGWLHRAMGHAQDKLETLSLPEWLPQSLLKKAPEWPAFAEALKALHRPESENALLPTTPARTRLAMDELFATQLALVHARQTTRLQPGIAHGSAQNLTQKFILPYLLTADQEKTLREIKEDLHAPTPMLRLVQGDVGSGKTIVALMALLHVIENGHQGVLMAPTEILARQHYATAKKLLEPLGITVALLTGSATSASKKRLKQHIEEGFVNLAIGTHALVQEDMRFDKLGLAVIDEQHRFGVHARLALSKNQSLPPDILVMTATPIPRTLALTAFGDMDVSSIKTKPPGRTAIQTVAMPASRMSEISASLSRILKKGEQVYWICPLVEESEESDLTATTARFAALQKHYGESVGLLHGKMKPKEKDAAMEAFKEGRTKILVSTTVVEVGVDVPNATLMVIEHAERFGLAQLHQLRGRVGRSALASRCILLYHPPLSEYAQERLQALRDSEDGFYLAEQDLRLRGPGEILGTRQSGQTNTMLADLYHHAPLIPLAREAAEKVLAAPLTAPQRQTLTLLLRIFKKQAAATYLRSG
ncbi:MAG: ATP-dependent DNA helicase RecG [Alphaproteobacteria bacterium CG_4_10_14_0_8_um_filter_53_9]|nr:MAG: ATP-dependent DNA helicase RecG [Alphaproteobacteria bacterium CG_4_10_14_0_8_um_filter_53_9]